MHPTLVVFSLEFQNTSFIQFMYIEMKVDDEYKCDNAWKMKTKLTKTETVDGVEKFCYSSWTTFCQVVLDNIWERTSCTFFFVI